VAGSIIWGTETIKALKGSAPSGERRGLQRRYEVRCADCGYDGVVDRFPDRCPMCRGTGWETVDAPGSQSPSWAVER
jgi:predicted Zn-ribbon and HTH transcriptional regulator